MHVKKGDTVKVISGKNTGQIGEILYTLPKKSQVVVKGVNIKTKHLKSQKEGEKGKVQQVEFPIHGSNVMLHSKVTGITSRVKYTESDHVKVRQLVKNNELMN